MAPQPVSDRATVCAGRAAWPCHLTLTPVVCRSVCLLLSLALTSHLGTSPSLLTLTPIMFPFVRAWRQMQLLLGRQRVARAEDGM